MNGKVFLRGPGGMWSSAPTAWTRIEKSTTIKVPIGIVGLEDSNLGNGERGMRFQER